MRHIYSLHPSWALAKEGCKKINDENMKKITSITAKFGDTVIEYAPQQIQ